LILNNDQIAQEPVTLLSPLGLSPGLLYSALMTIKPQRLVLLTSAEGEHFLAEIIRRADYHWPVEVVQVDDPFNCFNQAGQKVDEVLNLIGRSPCVVNITGGTTALQFIIQRADTALEKAGAQVHYVAFIDRRSIQAQKDDPWVVGELVSVT
jgi:hypothetical protein